jgi:protein-S-isoprenylcysteine O-methyltransferase Ste14
MSDNEQTTPNSPALTRTLVLIYGVISYFVGVVGLLAIVALAADLVPAHLQSETAMPVLWNIGLVAAWGVIHSYMARRSFKSMLTRLIPEPAERPTYVLVAGISSLLMVGLWQEMSAVIWSVESPALVTALWVMFGFGWVYTLAATFAINHFDLFGLRQVYLHFRNLPRDPLNFVKRAMYRFSRHPIQTGVLIGIWFTPLMTASHLILSIGFTIYIFIGLWFEEKDLIRDIGEPYEQYRREAGMFLPKFW